MTETATETAAPTIDNTVSTQPDNTIAPGPPTGQQVGQVTTTTAPVATQPAGEQPQNGLPTDPAELQRIISDLRRENAASRTNAKQAAAEQAKQELAQQIGKALGLVKDEGETVDPAQITAQLEQAQQQARQSAVELAVYRAAGKHAGDPDALLDSRSFLARVATLDPTADDFAGQVDAAIRDAVAANPKLKTAAQAAGRAGTEMSGGTGEPGVTQDQFDRMSYQERAELFQKDPTTYQQLAGTA